MRRIRSYKRKLFIKALKSRKLKSFLEKLKDKGLLSSYLEELDGLKGVLQDPYYHPEGDVWIHTLKCVNVAEEGKYPFSLVLASLFHDVGKGVVFDGDHFFGHEKEGAKRVVKFFLRYPISKLMVKKVRRLVLDHMKLHHPLSERKILNLVRGHPYLDELLALTEIDIKGSCGYSETFLENRRKIDHFRLFPGRRMEKPSPLLDGYEIMASLGLPPGKKVGILKSLAYEAQLKGMVKTKDEAIDYLRSIFRRE